jgi:hypothetical protein
VPPDAGNVGGPSAVDDDAFSQAPSYASRFSYIGTEAGLHESASAYHGDGHSQISRIVEDEPLFEENILLMTITRSPRELAEALHRGHELEAIIMLNEREGYSCRYQDGHIFVHPRQFPRVLAKIKHMGTPLRKYHVIVSETYEPNVRMALQRLRSRLDIRPKTSQPLMALKKPSDQLPYGVVPNPHGDDEDLLIVDKDVLIHIG